MLLSGIIAAPTSLLLAIIILLLLLPNACYVVEQQHGRDNRAPGQVQSPASSMRASMKEVP